MIRIQRARLSRDRGWPAFVAQTRGNQSLSNGGDKNLGEMDNLRIRKFQNAAEMGGVGVGAV